MLPQILLMASLAPLTFNWLSIVWNFTMHHLSTMLPFNFNMFSILILICFCDLRIKCIRKFFEIVEVFGDAFRPTFWLGNFNSFSSSKYFVHSLQWPDAIFPLHFTSIPFITRKTFYTQTNNNSGTKGYFRADYFTWLNRKMFLFQSMFYIPTFLPLIIS